MPYFVGFLVAPPAALRLTPSIFGQWQASSWSIYQASFIYMRFVVPQFWMFRCLPTSRKNHFRFVLGDFSPITSQNITPFLEGHHKIFAEVPDNVILLIYFSLEALRYIIYSPLLREHKASPEFAGNEMNGFQMKYDF